jgi:ankyrin repeat protein
MVELIETTNNEKIEESKEQLRLHKKLINLLIQNKNEKQITRFIETTGININYYNDNNNILYQLINLCNTQSKYSKYDKLDEFKLLKQLKILTPYGINYNIELTNGIIPLFELLKFDSSRRLLRYVKNHGANMFQKDNKGRNLLMYALEIKANMKVIKYLFSLNFNLSQQDNEGNTIYMYATTSYSINTYNKVLPFLLRNFVFSNNIIISLILHSRNKIPATNDEINDIIKNNNKLINMKNNEGDTALFIAIKSYRGIKIISFLIQLGSRLDEVDRNGSCPLMIAAEYRNFLAFKYILRFHKDLNFKNYNNDTPLIISSKSNNTSMVKLLLSEKNKLTTIPGFDSKYLEEMNAYDKDGDDNFKIEELKNVKINEQNNEGETALLIAVIKKNFENIFTLISSGADPKISNNKNETPLMIAVRLGDEKVVDLILSVQKDIDDIDINHETALMIAIKNGEFVIAYRLLQRGADFTIRDKDFRTPLMIASCSNAGYEVADFILKKENKTIDYRDKDGKTALLLAIEKKNNLNAVLLMTHGALPYDCDNKKNNALIIASKMGYDEIVRYILDMYDIDVDSKNANLNTALMKASKHGHAEVVRYLLKTAKKELTNKDGDTALIIGCMHGHLNVAEILIEANANIECFNKQGITPLIASCKSNNYILLETMISVYGAKINNNHPLVRQRMEDCFIENIEKGHYEIIQILLKYGVKIDVSNRNNTFYRLLSALITAVEDAQYKTIEEVLSQKQYREVLKEFRKTQLLIKACRGGKRKTIEVLLNLNVDVNVVDEQGNTALIEASKDNALYSYVKSIVKRKANLNAVNNEGTSALLNSCKIPENRIFKFLINNGANIYISDHDGNNALMHACSYGETEKIKFLVKKRVGINAVNNDGDTALMQSVRAGKVGIVKYLLKHKVKVNVLNRKNQNALVIAFVTGYDEVVKYKYLSIIKMLIDSKSDPNVPVDDTGNSILMFLIMKNDFNMIKYLVEHGHHIDINQKNHLGHNAFTYALKCNNLEIINYLIKRKFDIHEEDDYGNDMIMYSTCSFNPEYFKNFIQDSGSGKTEINKCNHNKETYLIMAAKMNNERVIDVILEKGADVNLQDSQGNTALHFAAYQGNVETLGKLINHQADLEIQNYKHETPVMVACRFNQPDAIRALIDNGANTNFIDPIINRYTKNLDYEIDQDDYIDMMIDEYEKISVLVPKSYLSTTTLIERMQLFYEPSEFKNRFEGVEEHIVDGIEEFLQLCVETITGAN